MWLFLLNLKFWFRTKGSVAEANLFNKINTYCVYLWYVIIILRNNIPIFNIFNNIKVFIYADVLFTNLVKSCKIIFPDKLTWTAVNIYEANHLLTYDLLNVWIKLNYHKTLSYNLINL